MSCRNLVALMLRKKVYIYLIFYLASYVFLKTKKFMLLEQKDNINIFYILIVLFITLIVVNRTTTSGI
ncbi:hypothetical protein CYQ70_07175 [Enterococcus faecium]|nr:hypothetical protein CYQ70_07175 [Enterococcus faecium]